jgi:hypothetical protein
MIIVVLSVPFTLLDYLILIPWLTRIKIMRKNVHKGVDIILLLVVMAALILLL